jgi:putative transposase
LEAAAGTQNIHQNLGCSAPTVTKWRSRWVGALDDLASDKASAIQVLSDAPRCGAPARITVEHCAQIIAIACTAPAEFGLPIDLWSIRELRLTFITEASAMISERHLRRILDEAQIRPHKVRYWLNKKYGPPSDWLDGKLSKFEPSVCKVGDSARPMHHS